TSIEARVGQIYSDEPAARWVRFTPALTPTVVCLRKEAATVPGNRITDLQVTKYKELRGKHTQEAAASKTGISVSSARRIESTVALPSQRPPRHWRTRADPLSE